MNDRDIAKLAAQLAESLATKEDIKSVKDDIKRLEQKIDEVNEKSDTILKYADAVDETVEGHGKRLKAIPAVAHELKKKPS